MNDQYDKRISDFLISDYHAICYRKDKDNND